MEDILCDGSLHQPHIFFIKGAMFKVKSNSFDLDSQKHILRCTWVLSPLI